MRLFNQRENNQRENHDNHIGSRRSVKTLSALLAGAMAFGGGGAALADAATAATTPAPSASSSTAATAAASGVFSDVAKGFWAEKHIYKLAGQGIIVGNNGKFRPGDSVTQQEAVLMALRFMGADSRASGTVATALPGGIEVSNYYKSYIVLAFQMNLLDKNEEASATTSGNTAWGSRPATREWIAELLIRSLGKSAEAQAAASEKSGFADDAKISANKRGYINAAIDLGLTTGLAGNLFSPQGEVTRAQLATFFSRAEAYSTVAYGNTTSGTILDIKEGRMTLYNGVSKSVYSLSASTGYFTAASENGIALTDVQPYTKVTVIGSGTVASYVEVTDPNPQVETLQGTLASISTASKKLWLKTADGYPEYVYDDAAAFVDAGGNTVDPSAITENSTVTLLREKFTGQNKLIKVMVTSGVVNKTATGVLKAVDKAAQTITFTTAAGSDETYGWTSDSIFSYKSTILNSADLTVGAPVKFKIKNSKIASVEVTEMKNLSVQGTLTERTSTSLIYKKSDGSLEVKALADNPILTIPGVTSPSLDDLVADSAGGDVVELTLDASNKVTRITVTKRQMDQYFGVSVASYNTTTKLLTVLDASGNAKVVQLDDKTKISGNFGITPTITTVGPMLTDGRKLNLNAIGQRLLTLEFVSQYDGTFTSYSAASRTMTIKTNDGRALTLPYPTAVDIFGQTGKTVADVPAGSTVTATLASNQLTVTSLKLKTTQQFAISLLDAASNKLKVSTPSGNVDIYTLTVPITDENGNTIKIGDLKSGDLLNVTSVGSSPVSIQRTIQSVGRITAVDTTGNKLTVQEYGGLVRTLDASRGVQIVRSGAASSSLSTLSTEDRAYIRQDADGKLVVEILSSQSRAVAWYESSSNQVVVKRSSLTDENYRFTLAPNVYLHQGDTTLSVQSLKENDKITLYFNGNVVVEIVKS